MRIAFIFIPLLLAACSSLSTPAITPHKIDIQQGNLVTPEMRDKIKLGMSAAMVRSILGAPLITDPFHAKRWDYAYRLEEGGKLVRKQRLTLYFEDERLARIDDSEMPAASEKK